MIPPLEPAAEIRTNTAEGNWNLAMLIEAVTFFEVGFVNPISILQSRRAQSAAWSFALLFSAH